MSRLQLAGLCFALIIFNSHTIAKPFPGKKMSGYVSHFENVLGTSMELKVMAASPGAAAYAEHAALQEISRLSKILSAYDADSEFSRWLKTQQQPVHVSKELFEVMQLFDDWHSKTSGALDPAAEAINRVWKNAAASGQLPNPESLKQAVDQVRQAHWELNQNLQTATHLGNAPLMLNSFVKSYIIKNAVDKALLPGKTSNVVMNIGGDIIVRGDQAETILVTNPKAEAENEAPVDQLLIHNKAIATSGNYRRGELILGNWYSHIVDPRTGIPADDIMSATVVADNATDAGALATAFNVMRTDESIQLASTIKGAEYLIITKTGEKITSKGWSALQLRGENISERMKPSGDEFELQITLEINLQQQGFAKRPYVAVWIEDENHAAVRTITVWHGSDRYINELKSWYLKYRNQYTTDNNFHTSVTSATRSAGKYTLKWDGRDDKAELVKPGKYTLKIEVTREHGTYQLMRQELEWNGVPKQYTIPGNIEIAAVSLDYRKKTNP